jgi:hypothetical protein
MAWLISTGTLEEIQTHRAIMSYIGYDDGRDDHEDTDGYDTSQVNSRSCKTMRKCLASRRPFKLTHHPLSMLFYLPALDIVVSQRGGNDCQEDQSVHCPLSRDFATKSMADHDQSASNTKDHQGEDDIAIDAMNQKPTLESSVSKLSVSHKRKPTWRILGTNCTTNSTPHANVWSARVVHLCGDMNSRRIAPRCINMPTIILISSSRI